LKPERIPPSAGRILQRDFCPQNAATLDQMGAARHFGGLETRKIKPIVEALLPWFAANARDLPRRRTRDPYAIHVSEIIFQDMDGR